MPFVTLTLLKGKSRDHYRAIADGVHEALVQTYGVPLQDRFQVIRTCDAEDLIYDETYLGIQRSPDVVFIHITASNTRSLEQKQALYKAIAERLGADPGLRPEDVQITLIPNVREDWSFGNGIATYVK